MSSLIRVFICLFTLGAFLYFYVDQLNAHTELKVKIPALAKEIENLEQSSIQLAYEIECFKNPQNLMQLAKQPQYSHLKFPYQDQLMEVPVYLGKSSTPSEETPWTMPSKSRLVKLPVLLGTK